MSIKRVLITNTLRKGFFRNGLEHRNMLRTISQAVSKLNTAKIRSHKNSQILWTIEVPRFCGILCKKPDNMFWKIL